MCDKDAESVDEGNDRNHAAAYGGASWLAVSVLPAL